MMPKDSNIYNFDPGYIEGLIARNDWDGCWEYLAQVIENLTITASPFALSVSLALQKDMKDEKGKQYVKEFGSLLGELFLFLLTEKSVLLPDKSFHRLIFFHETLHTLFYIYNIDNTDQLIKQMMAAGKKNMAPSDQKKLLLLLSLDTELDINAILRSVDEKYRISAVIAYFGHRKIFRKNIYNNKVRLYTFRKDFEKAPALHTNFINTSVTYFVSSYLNTQDKHSIKDNINTAFRIYLNGIKNELKAISDIPPEKERFKRNDDLPTVLVIAESFSKNHAMYRCWGQRTGSIQSKFNVILTLPADHVDKDLAIEYENFAPFEDLSGLCKVIHDAQPDIIFMPSVGMRIYNIFASNMRNAPIQIMGLGHPATSMSDCIDYVIGQEGLYEPEAFPKDIYLPDDAPRTFTPLLSKEKFFAPIDDRPEQGTKTGIHIGVVGSDIKVSYPFFKLLKEIVDESPFDIHVSFMIGIGGIDSLYIEKYLQENFKNSTYHGWQTYEDYIKTIKQVDIVLNPFPFGHTNTIVDTLMCNKPCIGMDGIEPASKTETYVLEAVGLKDMFVAKNEDDYKQKFFAYAARILKGDTTFFDRDKLYDQLFAPSGETDYGRIIKWIYDNHDTLKASGKKYFVPLQDI